jgi:predicted DCC family thiol-disulfide oxidoreductase YuxK
MWLPSSLPMATWNDTSVLLNQELLMKFLGYLVLVFEGLFIFLFWFRSLRVPLMLIGILFHIGILIIYPIPWFALTLIAVYLLMLPETFWFRLSKMFKSRSQGYRFYYDSECPLCIKVVVAIKHIDVFNRISCLSVQDNASKDSALSGVSEEELLINIHGVTKKGKVYVGYHAYRNLFVQLIYTFPLAVLMVLPGLSVLGKKMYRYMAGDRLTVRCTEQNCRIPQYTVPPSDKEFFLEKGWNKTNFIKKFWSLIMISFFIYQCLVIFFSPFIQEKLGPDKKINKVLGPVYYNSKFWFKKYLGVAKHDVFVKEHFDSYNHILKSPAFLTEKK